MKNQIYFTLFVLFFVGVTVQAKKTTVIVNTPGTLPSLIAKEKKYQIEELALEGSLNGTDLRFLREMAGSDINQKPTDGKLRKVDLSNATFMQGGEAYIYKDVLQYTAGKYTIPKFLFRNCKIEEIVLPTRTDSIGVGALEMTRLKRIDLPEKVVICAWAFNENPELEEVIFPSHVLEMMEYSFKDCKKLKQVILHNVNFISFNTFFNLPVLEKIEVKGFVEHISGSMANNCPQLKGIDFRGPVLTTQNALAYNCATLDHINFHDFVINVQPQHPQDCPLFNEYSFKGINFWELNFTEDQIKANEKPHFWILLEKLADIFKEIPSRRFQTDYYVQVALFQGACWYAIIGERTKAYHLLDIAADLGFMDLTWFREEKYLESIRNEKEYIAIEEKIRQNGDYIFILRNAEPYTQNRTEQPRFTYAEASDSNLVKVREYFNLDSIAGQGDEITQIKNLLYWLHDSIRHDGSSSWPNCEYNAIDLYKLAKAENRGYNCRFMAMMLSEIYLAMGFKSRFLTCESKKYDTDSDCHVINIVWSTTLNKWVWMDPTFAAYVWDENGLLLHPGEVRDRLIKGLPLHINEDANWNHQNQQTVEEYLEKYMAKNLYIISAFQSSEFETQPRRGRKSPYITLAPPDSRYKSDILTNDDSYFWQAPE